MTLPKPYDSIHSTNRRSQLKVPLSLRGAKRRGNLLLQSIQVLYSNMDRTGRLPRPFGPRNDSYFYPSALIFYGEMDKG